MKEIFAFIMAGGVGSRFWPRSKERKPKQLLRIFGENTMIQDTVARLDGLIPKDHIYVITNKIQTERVIEQLPDIPTENIIAEPFGKNTAPCIGLASVIAKSKSEDAITIILPSDHVIKDKAEFQQTLKNACDFAYKSKGLVTIGIPPSRPETGYGYIQINENKVEDDIFPVLTFAEKPNLSTAQRFLNSGDFLWNSGMFIWRVDAILGEIQKFLPDLYDGLQVLEKSLASDKFEESLVNVWGQLKSISIDYGIMEKSEKVFLTPGKFDWSDVGSWEAVYQLSEKDEIDNVLKGDVYTHESSNSYVFSPKKFTALIGVENLIVIETNDALLICDREKSQNVKLVVDYLRMHKRSDLL